MTIGTDRVRLGFNPSEKSTVANIKQLTADLIDMCETIKRESPYGEQARLASLAQTAYEEAAMWAVKAATS